MATSEVEIANMALGRIGGAQQIADFEEHSAEAAACKLWYPLCRDRVLEDMDWPFARVRVGLGEDADNDPPAEWGYQYVYPSGAMAIRSLSFGGQVPQTGQRVPFEVVARGTTGRAILANISPATAVYTAKITTVALYPPSFASAVAWLMATELAMVIPKSGTVRDASMRYYLMELNAARANALNENQDLPEPESEFIQVRDAMSETFPAVITP